MSYEIYHADAEWLLKNFQADLIGSDTEAAYVDVTGMRLDGLFDI